MSPTTRPPLADAQARHDIVNLLTTSLLVEAAAGTGKTTCMVERMLELVATGTATVEHVAAVTFTKKAALELRSRFRERLETASRDEKRPPRPRDLLRKALHDVEHCFVGTIHAFCARMLRERPVEARLDVGFRELDTEDEPTLRTAAWAEFAAELHDTLDPLLGRLAERGLRFEDLEAGFGAFATYPDVEEWPTPPAHAPDTATAVEHLAAYVERMKGVLATNPGRGSTEKLLPRFDNVVRRFERLDTGDPTKVLGIMNLFASEAKATPTKWAPDGASKEEKATAKEFAKAEQESHDRFRLDVAMPYIQAWLEWRYEVVVELYRRAADHYADYRHRLGLASFADLLMACAAMLRTGTAELRRFFRDRYRHLLVDEFQDTDPIQAEMMMLLTADDETCCDWRTCRPVPGSLFVVGDPKQSIYRFRRADIATYDEVRRLIEAAGGRTLTLSANFRTLRPIVDWVNQVFSEPGRFPADPTPQAPAYVALEPVRDGGAGSPWSGVRRLDLPAKGYAKDARSHEADFIARTVADAIRRGTPIPVRSAGAGPDGLEPARPAHFMVVTARKKDIADYVAALENLGIPCQVAGGRTLAAIPELSLLRRLVAAAVDADDPVALLAILRSELFGLSDRTLYEFRLADGRFNFGAPVPDSLSDEHRLPLEAAFSLIGRCARWLETLPPAAALERVVEESGLVHRARAGGRGDVAAGGLYQAIESVRTRLAEGGGVDEMLGHLDALLDENSDRDALPVDAQSPDVVRVMNLHKVKGLEAPVVFLASVGKPLGGLPSLRVERGGGVVRGWLQVAAPDEHRGRGAAIAQPQGWDELARDETEFGTAEVVRLLYVAATRAGSALVVNAPPRDGPWQAFAEHLAGVEPLPDPGKQEAVVPAIVPLRPDEEAEGARHRLAAFTTMARPTYRMLPAKKWAEEETFGPEGRKKAWRPQVAAPTAHGPDVSGAEWGTLVHRLLETAMKSDQADLAVAARSVALDLDLPDTVIDGAVRTARAVSTSAVWARARASERHLVEVPFEFQATTPSNAPPTFVRGCVDLAFREAGGWVLVDYKTDRATADTVGALILEYTPQLRTYVKAWERCTGEPVVESGLLFIGLVGVDPAPYRPIHLPPKAAPRPANEPAPSPASSGWPADLVDYIDPKLAPHLPAWSASGLPEPEPGVDIPSGDRIIAQAMLAWPEGDGGVALLHSSMMPPEGDGRTVGDWHLVAFDEGEPCAWIETVRSALGNGGR